MRTKGDIKLKKISAGCYFFGEFDFWSRKKGGRINTPPSIS
jgi:hypothetical protein